MAIIKCSRCSSEKEGMSEAPYQNQLGQKVLQHICQECWEAWIKQQLMLMNEYRLDPLNDEHSQFLDTEMIKFFNLT